MVQVVINYLRKQASNSAKEIKALMLCIKAS